MAALSSVFSVALTALIRMSVAENPFLRGTMINNPYFYFNPYSPVQNSGVRNNLQPDSYWDLYLQRLNQQKPQVRDGQFVEPHLPNPKPPLKGNSHYRRYYQDQEDSSSSTHNHFNDLEVSEYPVPTRTWFLGIYLGIIALISQFVEAFKALFEPINIFAR